jgi:hypothetical protein
MIEDVIRVVMRRCVGRVIEIKDLLVREAGNIKLDFLRDSFEIMHKFHMRYTVRVFYPASQAIHSYINIILTSRAYYT